MPQRQEEHFSLDKDEILETIGIEHIDNRGSGFFPNGDRKCDSFSNQVSKWPDLRIWLT